ncbi:MAG: hypothetical protein DRG31_06115, partial [Deltaproteobacteria bacterium]
MNNTVGYQRIILPELKLDDRVCADLDGDGEVSYGDVNLFEMLTGVSPNATDMVVDGDVITTVVSHRDNDSIFADAFEYTFFNDIQDIREIGGRLWGKNVVKSKYVFYANADDKRDSIEDTIMYPSPGRIFHINLKSYGIRNITINGDNDELRISERTVVRGNGLNLVYGYVIITKTGLPYDYYSRRILDVNNDGHVDIYDYYLIRNLAYSRQKTTCAMIVGCGDLNGDGYVNMRDYELLENEMKNGSKNPVYDVNGNGLLDSGDLIAMNKFVRISENRRDLCAVRRVPHGCDFNLDGECDKEDTDIIRLYYSIPLFRGKAVKNFGDSIKISAGPYLRLRFYSRHPLPGIQKNMTSLNNIPCYPYSYYLYPDYTYPEGSYVFLLWKNRYMDALADIIRPDAGIYLEIGYLGGSNLVHVAKINTDVDNIVNDQLRTDNLPDINQDIEQIRIEGRTHVKIPINSILSGDVLIVYLDNDSGRFTGDVHLIIEGAFPFRIPVIMLDINGDGKFDNGDILNIQNMTQNYTISDDFIGDYDGDGLY